MSTWQEQVEAELEELTEKIVDLSRFMTEGTFRDQFPEKQQQMQRQRRAMVEYADCLSNRLYMDRRSYDMGDW